MKKIWKETEWKIEELIGQGSFGKVYRISKEDFGHIYEAALKIIEIPQNMSEIENIRNEGMDDKSINSYFYGIVEDIVKEFELMSRLKGNTNIVSYEDHMISPKENEFGWEIGIRMELLTPLEKYMRQYVFSIRDVIQLGIGICRSIELCQKQNIIHRDIKPGNIFVTKFGDYKLGDFGIARQLEKTSYAMSRKGTYDFMAPEIYKGSPYDSTVDIYSLGIVMYRYLNKNRAPFLPAYPNPVKYSDKEKANLLRIGGAEMKPPCNAVGKLAEVILKACAYLPENRYKKASDMRRDLENIYILCQNDSDMDLDIISCRKEEASVGENKKDIKTYQEDETVLMFSNDLKKENKREGEAIKDNSENKKLKVVESNKNLVSKEIKMTQKSGKYQIPTLSYRILIIVAIFIFIFFGVSYLSLYKQENINFAKIMNKGRSRAIEECKNVLGENMLENLNKKILESAEEEKNKLLEKARACKTYEHAPVQMDNGHVYAIFNFKDLGLNTYDECVEYCESVGGHLVTLTSEEETQFIVDYMHQYDGHVVLVGLSKQRDGKTWEWVTGEKLDYVKWGEGQPSEHVRADYAVTSKKTDDGQLINHSHGNWETWRMVCEWE